MDLLTLYGLVAVALMLVFYALEDRWHWCVLAFALACLMASSYGFLQGAWPFGVVEAVWFIVAIRRWKTRWGRLSTSAENNSVRYNPSERPSASRSKTRLVEEQFRAPMS